MTVWIGTSGWQYKDWRGPVYPENLKQALWLEHYVTLFDTVEVNNAFYRLPEETTFASWRARTPEGFVVTVKASRYLTHIKRLADPEPAVDLFHERARHLKERVGPILVQLPPKFRAAPDRLDATLTAFRKHGYRVAVECRDDSWYTDEVRDVLTRHDAPLVWADRHGRPLNPLWRTGSWGYVRLHEGDDRWPCYTDATLEAWAQRIGNAHEETDDVYLYLNNDPRGCAVHDAARFARIAQRLGVSVTRAPDPNDHEPVTPEPQPATTA